MVDWYNRDDWHASANFEFEHDHACPECGKVHLCVLMTCRGVDRYRQACWPCRLAGGANE